MKQTAISFENIKSKNYAIFFFTESEVDMRLSLEIKSLVAQCAESQSP